MEKKPTILISGGSGLVGRYLTSALLSEGFAVSHLSRRTGKSGKVRVFRWDPDKEYIDTDALKGTDHIIHLAGANIGEKRWTKQRKEEIRKSRIDSAGLIYNVVKDNDIPLKTFITASGISYYGTVTTEKIFDETDPPADDFLGNICREWEEAADLFSALGTRTVRIRTAVALEKNDSAIQKMTLPARFGFLGYVGNGRQYMPWIHVKDLAAIYVKALKDDKIEGAYNAVSPQHVTHKEFMQELAKVLKKPLLPVPLPAVALKMAYGEMADIVLKGSRASSEKIRNAGFRFDFEDLHSALEDIFFNRRVRRD